MDFAALFAALPTAYLVMSPDLVIVEANAAYLQAVGRTRRELVGRPVFDAFPPSPGSLDDQGRNPVQLSFERARDTGRPDHMPLSNYDIVDSATGQLSRRFWSLISAPVLDDDGKPMLVLQRTEDVTDYVIDREDRDRERERGLAWQRRAEVVEADLFARAAELRAALQAQETASRRLDGLSAAALRLAAAETLDELVETVVATGMTALGADGGAVAVRDDAQGIVRLSLTDSLGDVSQERYAELALDDPLPAAWAARTGEPVLLPDRAAGLAWSATMAEVYEATHRSAWAALPLRVGERLLGSLTASWAEPRTFEADEVELLSAFAAQCAQVLDRMQVRATERRAAVANRQMSEALQRSLLTAPQQPDHLEIAVRYRPAAEQVQVGGDWYDAFLIEDGSTCLVVGDVTGHDREAAAVMGQIRNLLRGIAYTVGDPPALVLKALDRAMRDLEVGALATAVLGTVEQTPEQREAGVRLLRWSSAGHPPPLYVGADGSSRLLEHDPDLLLGVAPETARRDHEQELEPGCTVLLYTDGLIERRGVGLDEGLAWLTATVGGLAHLSVDELCDRLLAEVAETAEDDIALLALRAHPEDRPRPQDAAPAHVPQRYR